MLMPEYRDVRGEQAAQKAKEASGRYSSRRHTRPRNRGRDYVRATVGLATVLFLTSMSQRFKAQRNSARRSW